MTDDAYYSYKPRARLPAPIAIAGIPGADVGQTGRVVSMLTGVACVRVDDQVSHRAGKHRELLPWSERRTHERAVLEGALSARSPGLTSLSAWTLDDPELGPWVRQAFTVLVLDVSFDEAVRRIVRHVAKDGRTHWYLREGQMPDPQALRPKLERLHQSHADVPWRVQVGARAPLQVGGAIADDLVSRWPF